MDRLDAMALFVAVVDEGSFAAAARRSGVSPASVSRAVAMLEERLGDRLLHRFTRSLRLTESGEQQAAVYRTVLADLAEAEGVGAATARVEGRISLTAPELFGRMTLMPVVEAFLAENPSASARVLLLLNRIVNLTEEGIDAAALGAAARFRARSGEARRDAATHLRGARLSRRQGQVVVAS